jgi:hypothetical protein
MKSGYEIIHDANITKDDTILEVVNRQAYNVVRFYAWGNAVETNWIKSTIGFWKIKEIKQ